MGPSSGVRPRSRGSGTPAIRRCPTAASRPARGRRDEYGCHGPGWPGRCGIPAFGAIQPWTWDDQSVGGWVMATSDPTWGELAMEGRFGVFGLWVVDQGGRRAEEVGCGLSWVGWCVGGELCGPSLHSQGSSGEDRAFALCARGGGVRFQCSFRLDPLTLGGSSLICSGLTDKQCRRRLRGTCGSDRCDAELCR